MEVVFQRLAPKIIRGLHGIYSPALGELSIAELGLSCRCHLTPKI